MNPAVRARHLRRSPTEGTPSGVSVDSRCRVSLVTAQFLHWRPCRAEDEPGGSPHCGAMARGGLAAEVFPASGFACACSIFVCGDLAGRKMNPAVRPTRRGGFVRCTKNARRGSLGGAVFRVGAVFQKVQSRGMCFSQQTVRVFSSHKLACTSPMCAQPIISMHRRDWPMPPPIVRGSSPSSSILWKGKARR